MRISTRVFPQFMAGLLAAMVTAQANSAPVSYQFSAFSGPLPGVTYAPTPLDPYLRAMPGILSGSFSYDSSVPTNGVSVPGQIPGVDNLTFPGAVLNSQLTFTAPSLPLNLSSSVMPAYATDNGIPWGLAPNIDYFDGLTISLWSDSTPGTYSIGEYRLEGVTLNILDDEFLTHPDLPATLTPPGGLTLATLYFRDALDQRVAFGMAASLQPVPVPAAAWLFGSALLGLAGCRRRG